MSANNDSFNPFDPTGMMREMRDASMDNWSKMMIQLVNTDAYAEATGSLLDAWLSSSGPFRRALESAMAQSLASLNLPTRDDVTRLAGRLTNIEMRLDDLEAKLDDSLPPAGPDPVSKRPSSGKKTGRTKTPRSREEAAE